MDNKPSTRRVNPSLQSAKARLAAASRRGYRGNPAIVAEARNDLLAARLERAINEALNPAPPYDPLSQFERNRLADVLEGVDEEGGDSVDEPEEGGDSVDEPEDFSNRAPLINQREAAEYLGVTVETVRAHIASGAIRASRLPGGRLIRINPAELDRFLVPLGVDEEGGDLL